MIYMSIPPGIFADDVSNFTHVALCTVALHINNFDNIPGTSHLVAALLPFVTFMSITHHIFVLGTSNYTTVHLCTMHLHSNNLEPCSK